MRRSELFRLKWEDVNFERGFITIQNPKGGKTQQIPLNDQASTLLMSLSRGDGSFVFPGLNGGQRIDIHKQVNRIKEKAGLSKDFRALHGLRHTYASALASSGKVDLYVLQRLLTHKDASMTARYSHLRDAALRRASDLAGEIIENGRAKTA
jgi:integrase